MKIKNIKTGKEFWVTEYQWKNRYSKDSIYEKILGTEFVWKPENRKNYCGWIVSNIAYAR